MRYYVDTSVIVAALTREHNTLRAQAWLRERSGDELLISVWTVTEVHSALAIKVRTRQIDDSVRAAALATFGRMTAAETSPLPIVAEDFRSATDLINRSVHPLRAGDALHLAVSLGAAATLCALDEGMVLAAEGLRVAAVRP